MISKWTCDLCGKECEQTTHQYSARQDHFLTHFNSKTTNRYSHVQVRAEVSFHRVDKDGDFINPDNVDLCYECTDKIIDSLKRRGQP